MTKEDKEQYSAECYIRSGYFPHPKNYLAIEDLRNKFNEFDKDIYLKGWLNSRDKHMRENAEKLFRLIYSDVLVDQLIEKGRYND